MDRSRFVMAKGPRLLEGELLLGLAGVFQLSLRFNDTGKNMG